MLTHMVGLPTGRPHEADIQTSQQPGRSARDFDVGGAETSGSSPSCPEETHRRSARGAARPWYLPTRRAQSFVTVRIQTCAPWCE
jgi:hypothetical protein